MESKPKQVKRKHQKELAIVKVTGFEDELDDDLEREKVPLVVPANPTIQVGKAKGNTKEATIDGLHPEEGYHSSHSSEDEREFEIPPGEEYYHFEAETSNVYFELKMEMPMTEVVELKLELIEYIPHYDLAESTNDLQCVKDLYGNIWIVYLVDHECSCVRWQLSGVVCVHDVRVIYPMRLDWTEYCSSYYWVSTYKQAYMGHIKPMLDPKDWPKPDPNKYVFPPPYVAALSQAPATQVATSSQASATQVAAPSQALTTQVAALSQAPATQVAAPSQTPATQVAAPSQATKLLASTTIGKKPMTRGKVAATTEALASVTQSKSVEAKELDKTSHNPKRLVLLSMPISFLIHFRILFTLLFISMNGGYIAQPTKPATVTFRKQAPKSKAFKAPHHQHTFRDFLEKQKMENSKTSKGLIAAATNLTFKPPPPPKRNIQAIGGFGQSMETFKPPPPPLAIAVPRQKFKALKGPWKVIIWCLSDVLFWVKGPLLCYFGFLMQVILVVLFWVKDLCCVIRCVMLG
ncbi:hypothetical protein IFM89_037197 [Coptis chinensis]|uniref:SWIM-type domain-containing protein n=1 Tax=Coptis chinensis TaxID=261450 RepID=A0A835HGS7_9MAGN|nr:hypothetical protein IFM89_037197 [Coptis chinensis]